MPPCLRCDAEIDQNRMFCDDCATVVGAAFAPDPEIREAAQTGPDALSADSTFNRAEQTDELLRDSIDYLQRRLTFVNNKSNIFIAIQTGLFVTIVWILGSFFSLGDQQSFSPRMVGIFVFLLLNVVFVVLVTALLLQTIRPTDEYFSLLTGIDTVDTTGIMWPHGDQPAPEEFTERVENLSEEDVTLELVGTVYALQQLVDRTYTNYRWAVLLMKIQVVVIPAAFILLLFAIYL